MDLTVNLGPANDRALTLSNPIMIASGTFGYDGYGRGYDNSAPLASLGAVIPKTFTRYERLGNPEPRWFPSSFREGWPMARPPCSIPSA